MCAPRLTTPCSTAHCSGGAGKHEAGGQRRIQGPSSTTLQTPHTLRSITCTYAHNHTYKYFAHTLTQRLPRWKQTRIMVRSVRCVGYPTRIGRKPSFSSMSLSLQSFCLSFIPHHLPPRSLLIPPLALVLWRCHRLFLFSRFSCSSLFSVLPFFLSSFPWFSLILSARLSVIHDYLSDENTTSLDQ